MNLINNEFVSRNINLLNNVSNKDSKSQVKNFNDIFNINLEKNRQNSNIQFSKHATTRLGNRNINLDSSQIQRIEKGVERANQKGIKDSLILVDNIALVVNIKTKTVITAVQNDSEKIYSNIDGAVIV